MMCSVRNFGDGQAAAAYAHYGISTSARTEQQLGKLG